MLTAQTRIENLVQQRLTPRGPDLVTVVQQFLALACEVGQIRCTMGGKDMLRFEVPGEEPASLALPLAKANLRTMCARLAKLRQESGQEFEPYGGEGVITREVAVTSYSQYAAWLKEQWETAPGDRNGQTSAQEAELLTALAFSRDQWKVSYKNTMHEQEFTITAV